MLAVIFELRDAFLHVTGRHFKGRNHHLPLHSPDVSALSFSTTFSVQDLHLQQFIISISALIPNFDPRTNIMPFRKLVNKLLAALNRERQHSNKSTSKSSSSFFRTSSLALPPPSYEEATATGTSITSTSTSTRRASLGQLADAIFGPDNDRTHVHFFRSKKKGQAVFSKEGQALLFVYYVLVDYGRQNFAGSYAYSLLQQRQVEGPPGADVARAITDIIGNYAFMLALLHCSKQYNIAQGRLSLSANEAVYAIRQHVKDQMVEDLLQGDKDEESRRVTQYVVGDVVDSEIGLELAVEFFEKQLLGGYKTAEKTRDSIDTGELDGAKVQECWSLFKMVLAERTTSGDLLPPPGFQCYSPSDQSQAAMRGIWR